MSTTTSTYPSNPSFANNGNPFAEDVSSMVPSSVSDVQQTSDPSSSQAMTEETTGQTVEQDTQPTTEQTTSEESKTVETTTEETAASETTTTTEETNTDQATGSIKEPIVEETAEPAIGSIPEATLEKEATLETAAAEIIPEATTVLASEPTTESTTETSTNEEEMQESFHQDPQIHESTPTITEPITSSSSPKKETDDQVLARVLEKFTSSASPLAKEIKQQAEQIDSKIRAEEEKERERKRKENERKKQQEQKKKQQSLLQAAKGKSFSWNNFLGFGMVASALGVLGIVVAKRFRWF